MTYHTIFTRFLDKLEVPHTASFSDEQFRNMTFHSLYGLSHLLTEYGVKNEGVKFDDKSKITELSVPFLAQTQGGIFVIVTKLDAAAGIVEYDSLGQMQEVDLKSFLDAWNGIALLAFPDADSKEPEYSSHRLTEIVRKSANYGLLGGFLGLFLYFLASRHLFGYFSALLLVVFDCIGLYLSFLLLQKSLDIHTAASDAVCGFLEQGGCDSIAKSEASKLFGVFSWSEIGFGYFGVSLITLLIFPRMLPWLALCNLCCLPYTCWSIWYQKFRAHHWCTLCVGVQCCLWLLFFCYLGGGWLKYAFPVHGGFLVMVFVYLLAVLSLNKLIAIIKDLPCHEKNY